MNDDGMSIEACELVARTCRWIGLGVVMLALTGFTPLANVVAHALRPPAEIVPSDAIVVLGADANPDGTLGNASLVRFVEGTVLYRQGLAPIIVFSGSPAETLTRARLARALGIPDAAILVEPRARTTSEEARLIAERLKGRAVRRILLVTNSAHLSRAVRVFEAQGLNVSAVPADDVSDSVTKPQDRLMLLRIVLQELAARIYYRVSGRI